MRLLARVVGHWTFALGAIVGVGMWFLVVPALTNQLGANPLEELLHRCGEIGFGKPGAAGQGFGEQVAGGVLRDEVAAPQHRVVEDQPGADQQGVAVGAQDLLQADAQSVVHSGDRRLVRRTGRDQVFQQRVVFVVFHDLLLAREVPEERAGRHLGRHDRCDR